MVYACVLCSFVYVGELTCDKFTQDCKFLHCMTELIAAVQLHNLPYLYVLLLACYIFNANVLKFSSFGNYILVVKITILFHMIIRYFE